jgi:hypothetical protein
MVWEDRVSEHRIMYVCTECADGYPEGCGHYDRSDLRLMPDGRWLCESCFDDTDQTERGNTTDDGEFMSWCDLPAPPAYGPLASEERS